MGIKISGKKTVKVNGQYYVLSHCPLIIFNGKFLPNCAYFIDVCSDYILPDLPDDIALWFWRFTICLGRPRIEKSEIVIGNIEYMIEEISKKRIFIKKRISELYIESSGDVILSEWIRTLNIMKFTARKNHICKWFAIPDVKRHSKLRWRFERIRPGENTYRAF